MSSTTSDAQSPIGPSATSTTNMGSRPRSRYYMAKMRLRSEDQRSADPVPSSVSSNKLASETPFTETLPSLSAGSPPLLSDPVEQIIPLGVPLDKTKSPWSDGEIGEVANELHEKVSGDLSMGVEEPEKLAWTGPTEGDGVVHPLPEAVSKPTEKEGLFEARFDPSGTILRPDSQIPVSAGLHHHGQDPEKPGYTLDEIFILLQSSSHPQKLWALTTLTAILRQAKLSVYDEYLEVSLLGRMAEEDMLLPLRHLLDHASLPIVSAAVKALEALLVNDVDEFMTDELLIVDKDPNFFELNPADGKEKDAEDVEESELTDVQLMKVDVITGFLRTSILKRLTFLLDAFLTAMDASAVTSLLAVLTRFVRHSSAVAVCVSEEGELMERVMSVEVRKKSPVAQMKLVRIMTSVLGPLNQFVWAEMMYHSAAGWISALRTVIDDTLVRDMVTESLNLLIVLAHYGVCPASISGIEDVFPQVLHSAGPKADSSLGSLGSMTQWDAGCCSRILTFLSLCLPLQTAGRALISDAMAMLVMQNCLTGYIALDKSSREMKGVVDQLRASYLLYASEYLKGERLECVRLGTPFVQHLRTSLPSLLDVSWIVERKQRDVSRVDPVCLPSYGIVERGGRTLLSVLEERSRLSLSVQAIRFMNIASVDSKLSPLIVSGINQQLARIPAFKLASENDFWSSYYVRVLVEIVKFGIASLTAKMDIEYRLLYPAALCIIPLLGEHQAADLKILLTKLIFSTRLLPLSSGGGSEVTSNAVSQKERLEDMATVQEVFAHLAPLGFVEDSQLTIVVPTRHVGVFTRTWMFDCFAYIVEWGVASEKIIRTPPRSREQCIRGYFHWLLHILRHIVACEETVLRLREVFVHLGDFFCEDGVYRTDVVGVCLKAVFRLIVTCQEKKLILKPSAVCQKKAFDDFYETVLDNYEASSYGDEVFTQYILIPVQQRHHLELRKKFWGPEKQIFAVVRIHHLDLCYPVEFHLEPAEVDLNLLGQFFTLLMTQNVTEKRTPLLFLICIHHLNRFLLRSSTSSVDTLRKKILLFLTNNQQATLTKYMICYRKPSSERGVSVFDLYDATPEVFSAML